MDSGTHVTVERVWSDEGESQSECIKERSGLCRVRYGVRVEGGSYKALAITHNYQAIKTPWCITRHT